MLENGYIRAHRSLVKWGWYKDIPTCKLWLHLLLCANYEPCEFMGREVQAGELVTSYASLAEGSGLTVKQVRTALDKLKKTGEIEVASNRHYTVITVKKYSLYQQTEGSQMADQGQTKGTPRADQGQTEGSQRATMKESKKARKQESKKSIGAHAPTHDELAERFANYALADAVSDWLAYKSERKEDYKPTGLKSLLTEIEHRADMLGVQPVVDVIRESMANGWRGIIWDRAQKITRETDSFAAVSGDW